MGERGILLTCAELPGAVPASADRAPRVFSSGPAQSRAGPAEPARSTTLSGCIPQASMLTAKEGHMKHSTIPEEHRMAFN